jgi:hypothetical protein
MPRNVSRSIAILAEAAFESPRASSVGVALAVVRPTSKRITRLVVAAEEGEGERENAAIVIKSLSAPVIPEPISHH